MGRRPDLDSLYCLNADGSRNTIHTADVHGRFQTRKKIVWAILIAIWVVLPWVKVGGHPTILIDIEHRSFYLFGATLNAQDFYLAFFLLTGIGITLFVVSSVFGRIWCGYSCPHTVFLEGVYRRIERWVEGTSQQRKRLKELPWNAEKLRKRGLKLVLFLAVSLFLSHNFLSYFLGAHEVLAAIVGSPTKHPTAFTFVVIATVIIFANFTWFREQLCIVICPYGRLQGVLYDRDTINVAYDSKRGEPRGRYTDSGHGDCIDCLRCVAVCPTGIDIRNGTQLECVGCANCIDACDDVMTKLGRPTGLVRYDSQNGIENGVRRILRPRLYFYAFLVLVGMSVFSVAVFRRAPFEANLLRQLGTPYEVTDSIVKNGLQLHLVNKQPEAHVFLLEPKAQPGLRFTVPQPRVELASLGDVRIPLWIEVDRSLWKPGTKAELVVRTEDGSLSRVAEIVLAGPR
ncbi:MAG: cytochrome c oxidase accessory protein CcoG [Planctomycetes bacterium]|nr:cytochrome c oxidase accessory protein CcoG [Planctomycetota bacterium]